MEPTPERVNAAWPKTINIVVAVAIGLAIVGFFVGTRPMPRPTLGKGAPAPASVVAGVMPGHAYRELRLRHHGPNSELGSDLDLLRTEIPGLLDEVVVNPADKAGALDLRRSRRAFDGAPPTIPHKIDQMDVAACVACHEQGMRIKGKAARVMSHDFLTNCTQCHVRAATLPTELGLSTGNSFAALESPGAGMRAWDGAPPMIPHHTNMRENCHSCHGVNGLDGLRTTHPERVMCVQCHVKKSR